MYIDEAIEADYPALNGCRLAIQLRGGETREAYLPNMKGEPEFRMSEDELREKFRMLTRELVDEARADVLYTACHALDSGASAADLLPLCAEAAPVPA